MSNAKAELTQICAETKRKLKPKNLPVVDKQSFETVTETVSTVTQTYETLKSKTRKSMSFNSRYELNASNIKVTQLDKTNVSDFINCNSTQLDRFSDDDDESY
jgi:hypothetical protein